MSEINPTLSEMKQRRQALIDALESGEFTQGKNTLTTVEEDGTQRDCCLGVACKVAIRMGLEVTVSKLKVSKLRVKGNVISTPVPLLYDGYTGGLPESVMRFYGFKTGTGLYKGTYCDGEEEFRDTSQDLVKDNDNKGHTFQQIAQTIRDNEKTMFIDA